MKEIITKLYSAFSKIITLRNIDNEANHPVIFPVVGFLSNEKKEQLEAILKIKIHKPEIFEQALTHRSYLFTNGASNGLLSNERLEYLGDSLLNLCVSDFLFKSYPDIFEGELTKIRSRLVNKNSLSYCGYSLGIENFIMLSFSAEKALKEGSDSIIADTVEAIIAAIYMDSDFDNAKHFVIDVLLPIMLDSKLLEDSNYKSLLLEKVQSLGFQSPTYHVITESGPDHNKEFNIGVYLDDVLIGSGCGKNKKAAEQEAAKNALDTKLFTNIKEQHNGNVNN